MDEEIGELFEKLHQKKPTNACIGKGEIFH